MPRNYRFKCKYDGINFDACPCNENGLCRTVYQTFPISLLHEFDGKNYIKCLCG